METPVMKNKAGHDLVSTFRMPLEQSDKVSEKSALFGK